LFLFEIFLSLGLATVESGVGLGDMYWVIGNPTGLPLSFTRTYLDLVSDSALSMRSIPASPLRCITFSLKSFWSSETYIIKHRKKIKSKILSCNNNKAKPYFSELKCNREKEPSKFF
jgi:hypothetical protein